MKTTILKLSAISILMFSGFTMADDLSQSYQNGLPFSKSNEYVQFAGYNYHDYATSASSKVFNVSGSAVNGSIAGNLTYDTEIRVFDRSVVGQTRYSRDRKLGGEAGVGVNYSVIYLDTAGDLLFSRFERYNNAGTVLKEVRVMSPGVLDRTESMRIGKSWGSYSQLQSTTAGISGVIQTGTLLGLENVSVAAGEFSGCLKIHLHRNSERLGEEYDRINWLCPDGVGLAKQVTMTQYLDITTGTLKHSTTVMELSAITQ